MKNSLKAIFVIIGTVIGAGFASGQEIYSFFNVYEENGIIGIFISILITGIVIYKVLIKSNELEIKTYNELIGKTNAPKKISSVFNIIINIFLLISFYIMVAGFIAYFKQEFNVPNIITASIILPICYITFMKNIEGIARINTVIIPILIIIVLILGFKTDMLNTINNMDMEKIKISSNWIIKSIEYASYNSILLIPILISLRKYSKNNEKKISIISTGIALILSIIIYLVLFKFKDIANIEIPLVYIANKYGSLFKCIYGLVIIFAIYTTMISAGYGFLENCSKNKKTYTTIALFMCISAIIISNISFSSLVNSMYPIFGILGLLQLIYIIRIKS